MNQKNLVTIGVILGVAYVGIYFYQRYQRKKSDENPTSYEDALKVIDDLK